MPTLLDGLRSLGVVLADTDGLDAIRRRRPQDHTTNPSLLLRASGMILSAWADPRHGGDPASLARGSAC